VRLLAGAAFCLSAAGLLLTLSRGGILAAAGALLIMAVWAPFRRLAAVVAVGAVVVVSVSGASLLGDVRLVDTVSGRISSIEYATEANPRIAIWEKTPQMLADHPLFGIGANAFPVVSPRYGVFSPDAEGGVYLHAHNIPLTIAVELGLLGLAGLAWLTVVLVRLLLRSYRRSDEAGRGLTVGIAAALFALALHGMVDYTLRLNAMVAAVLVLAGCAVILSRTGAEPALLAAHGGPPGRGEVA
jgi:putative inorganic carbon (hco3(-)) transporter